MNNFDQLEKERDSRARLLSGSRLLSCLVVALVALLWGVHASAQSRESATAGRTFVWVGGGVSDYYLQYGGSKIVGVTGFVDADTRRKLGIEAEGRWLDYRQTHNIHAETYLAGPRYHFNVNRVQPYVKGLAGLGKFNFPYNYATGKYFVIGAGGGADYFITPRLSVRGDFEYQYWPQFTFGAMSAGGVSVNLRYLILR
jgi:hypothetical protein